MTFEADLLNYGVLGAWTAWLIYEKKVLLKQLTEVIEANTYATDRLSEHADYLFKNHASRKSNKG